MPKKKPIDQHRIDKHIRLAPETIRGIDLLRETWGIQSDGQVIDRAVREATEREGGGEG